MREKERKCEDIVVKRFFFFFFFFFGKMERVERVAKQSCRRELIELSKKNLFESYISYSLPCLII